MILHFTLLLVGLVDVYSIYLEVIIINNICYVLGAQKRHLSEMVLLSTHNMCCCLIKGKIILHQTLLSGGLVDIYPIYQK